MRLTLRDIMKFKADGRRIPVLTCYDYTSAQALDEAGVPILLVGDSLGMVVHGFDSTIPVTLEMMLMHTAAVSRGAKRALVVMDMPFATYSPNDLGGSLKNAAKALSIGGAQAVKIEGGARVVPVVKELTGAGIPVMGHLGLTPQSIHQLGGYRVQAKDSESAQRLIDDAKSLEDAGVFGIVLELIPAEVAARVTEALRVPTIGIGAGARCSGQVQVFHDAFGLYEDFVPKHAKRFVTLATQLKAAAKAYVNEVEEGKFPG